MADEAPRTDQEAREAAAREGKYLTFSLAQEEYGIGILKVKEIIVNIRQQEHDADVAEKALLQKLFNMDLDPVTVFHMVRLTETIGSIADHAENAGDMMRAMLSR